MNKWLIALLILFGILVATSKKKVEAALPPDGGAPTPQTHPYFKVGDIIEHIEQIGWWIDKKWIIMRYDPLPSYFPYHPFGDYRTKLLPADPSMPAELWSVETTDNEFMKV